MHETEIVSVCLSFCVLYTSIPLHICLRWSVHGLCPVILRENEWVPHLCR